jgi:hypothetical protein
VPEQVANLDFIAFPAREVGQILVDRIAQGDKPAPAAEGDSGFNWAKSEPASTPAPKTLISACAIYFCFDSVDRALGRHIQIPEAIAPGAVAQIFRYGNFTESPPVCIEDCDGLIRGDPNVSHFVGLQAICVGPCKHLRRD